MYKSPVTITYDAVHDVISKMEVNTDERIYKAILNVGITVDKEELIKAIEYDRHQYEAGYADGKEDGKPRWIPVSERLPEDRRTVLVTAYWHETYQVMEGSYFGDDVWWCVPFNNCGEHMQRLKPIAWMSLPESYKENKA